MSAFKSLRDISNGFENYSKQVTKELFSAKIGEPFEDGLTKKIRDLSLYSSKLKFLEAKIIAETPQITECIENEQTTIMKYEKAASWKIVERQAVKMVTQGKSVKKLLTTPNDELEPELLEKKEKINGQLIKYREKDFQLLSLDAILKEKENQLLEARIKWHETLGKLRDTAKEPVDEEEMGGHLQQRLQSVVDKMEMMRWLITKLGTFRHDQHYDWATDPHKRLRALIIARQRDDIL